MVREGSQDRDSALHRSLVGDDHVWGLPEQLLATIVDSVQVGNWQFAAANSKKKPKKPKPVPRPGVGTRQGVKVGGDTAVPLSQAQEIFARHNPAAHAVTVAPPADTSPRCSADVCGRPVHARSLCSKHYQRWRRAQSTSPADTS